MTRQDRLSELLSWCKGDLALRVLEVEEKMAGLQEENEKLRQRISESEGCLKFYADGDNWYGVEDYDGYYFGGQINESDIVYGSAYDEAGSRRARAYFKKHKGMYEHGESN